MSERFFEDYTAGEVFRPSGRVRVDKEEIIAFARKYDPQPFHLDEEAARDSIFGQLVASGWHTAAMTMSLVARSEFKPAGGTIGLGFDGLRWSLPVLPGDELRIETEVLEVRTSKSRPDRGLMKMRTQTLNQHGQVVQELIANAMVPRRAAGKSA
jgi:acyl dehydratase